MTDGVLLAECHHDPYLNQYDTLIIDEAHERSLNIDFLLGYIKRLITKRNDLKVIITSATIDPERFARHFDDAPIINVSGRTYPVEVRYRPYQSADDDADLSLQDGIIHAVEELSKDGRGDILVFLSGERDIRETQDALQKQMQHSGNARSWGNTEILPLLARLSSAEQNKIFHPSGKRRIVLATNVAETSLTVPGIRYVIDSGVARISRYSWRSKMQRLPIEKISQASANQRKGRCGRVAEGICIRLFDEDDFNQRPEFTEPEIQRTNLAAVILQMEQLNLGHVDDFQFVEPPEERLVNDGYNLLFELGAIDELRQITKNGRHLARLPIEPKLARMLLEADKQGALSEVLIIVAALAVQEPRERPLDRQQAADQKHATFIDKTSDFVFYLNLWRAYFEQKKEQSGNQLRKWCKTNFISYMRMREWIDTHGQIRRILKEVGLHFNEQPSPIDIDYDAIHASLLTGLLSNVGFKQEEKEYLGARNRRFHLFPGSALYRSAPKWVMAAEIVETTRVYARTVAKIDIGWVERAAGHLLKRNYSNPHWEKKRAQVVVHEQATLYGLIVVADRKVAYEKIDPAASREIFIMDGLVRGDFDCRAAFYRHNRELIDELENLEARSRRRDIIVDEQVLYDFYNQRLPADIHSGRALEQWLRKHKAEDNKLRLKRDDLIRDEATLVSKTDFPDVLDIDGSKFPVEYHFDPQHHCDGITLITPLSALGAVNAQRCEWLVPGLLFDKVIALIRSLPKSIRRNFVPAPNYAEACVQALQTSNTSLTAALAAELTRMTGVEIPYDAWNIEAIPNHLLMNFRVIGNDGSVLEQGRNLQALKDRLANVVDESESTQDNSNAAAQHERDDIGPDVLGTLPESVELDLHGVRVKAYPALVVDGKQVNVRVLENERAAAKSNQAAMRQLVCNAIPEQIRHLRKSLPNIDKLCLMYGDFGRCDDLKQGIIDNTIDECFLQEPITDAMIFEQRIDKGREQLHETAASWCHLLAEILDSYRDIRKLLKNPPLHLFDTVTDIQCQLDALFGKDFITATPREWLQQYPRYLKAIKLRYDKAQHDAERDRRHRLELTELWSAYRKRYEAMVQAHLESERLEQYRWMLEEYRVSLFAQEVGTRMAVSGKRLKNYWREIDGV